MNVILTMSSFIFPLITFPYVSRVLLPVGTGKVQFATSLITYFNIFAQLGIPIYGVRAVAKVRDNREELTRTAHELLMINLFMSILAYIALAAALLTVHKLQDERTLYILMSSNILLSAIGMEWLYKGLEKYTYITVVSIIFKFLALIFMFMFIHVQQDYLIYGAIAVFAAAGSSIVNLIYARKYIDMKPVGGYSFMRHKNAILTFFAMACATTIYTNLDTLMLGFMKDEWEVGIYNASVKIKTILVSVVTSLGAVLLPRASYYVEQDNMAEFRRIGIKALTFVLMVSIPVTVYFMLYARETILFISGEAFLPSVSSMRWIMPTLILIGITNILGIQILVPLGKENIVLQSEIIGAVTGLIVNALLIPRMGSVGAAIGTLAAEFLVLVWQTKALWNDLKQEAGNINITRFLGSTGAAAAASIWILFLHKGVFLTLVLTALIFFGIYYFVLRVQREPMISEIEKSVLSVYGRIFTGKQP